MSGYNKFVYKNSHLGTLRFLWVINDCLKYYSSLEKKKDFVWLLIGVWLGNTWNDYDRKYVIKLQTGCSAGWKVKKLLKKKKNSDHTHQRAKMKPSVFRTSEYFFLVKMYN